MAGTWSNAKDRDAHPARDKDVARLYGGTSYDKAAFVFDQRDRYQTMGNTHGRVSHAIKHLAEFDKASFDHALKRVLMVVVMALKQGSRVWLVFHGAHQVSGEVVYEGSRLYVKDMRRGALTPIPSGAYAALAINTLDLVQDKRLGGGTVGITGDAERLIDRIAVSVAQVYEQIVERLMEGAVNVNRMTGPGASEEIARMMRAGKKVAFSALAYGNAPVHYIVDFSSKLLLTVNASTREYVSFYRINGPVEEKFTVRRGVCLHNPEVAKALVLSGGGSPDDFQTCRGFATESRASRALELNPDDPAAQAAHSRARAREGSWADMTLDTLIAMYVQRTSERRGRVEPGLTAALYDKLVAAGKLRKMHGSFHQEIATAQYMMKNYPAHTLTGAHA